MTCVCPVGTSESVTGFCILPDGAVLSNEADAGEAGADGCAAGSVRRCSDRSEIGECTPGEQTCVAGRWSECAGAVTAAAELCNGLDDDCDSVVDGSSATAACGSATRATGVACTAASCVITDCTAGYANCDGDFANGCEGALGSVEHCAACMDACGWRCEGGACNDAIAVSAGAAHTCAIRDSNHLVCWGNNSNGQIGDGTTTSRPSPVPISSLPAGVASIATDDHSCALLVTGDLWCWGNNLAGQLGDGTTTDRASPAAVAGLSGLLTQVITADAHTCVLLSTGVVRCWGANRSGELGNGTTVNSLTPTSVTGLTGVRALAAGQSHTCALVTDGAVRCWGANGSGQLGDGTTMNRSSPVEVVGLSGPVAGVAAGDSFTCAVLTSGGLQCWGNNRYGSLGDGTTASRDVPGTVSGGDSDVVSVGAGAAHACALRSGGTVECWGYNSEGEVGDGTTTHRLTPVGVVGLPAPVTRLSVGDAHACAILESGAVWCWGFNANAELGDGTTTSRSTAVAVLPP
jgi:alpha-tubulin suppressor-like RCC1 family protein